MANVYEALQRGREQAAPLAPPLARVSKPEPTYFGAEMRALAGRLQPLLDDRKPVTLAITASTAGEGASTVAREFAQHLASDGRSVLFCGDPAEIGVASRGAESPVIADVNQTREIRQTGYPRLSLVDISDLRREESSLVSKITFRDWLKANGEAYDVIIVDVPPVLSQNSWSGFIGFPDGIVLVVEAERARSTVLQATANVIEEANGHLLGLVFNKRRHYIPRSLYRWM